MQDHFINQQWVKGEGSVLRSYDPYSPNHIMWEGKEASDKQISNAVEAAKAARAMWAATEYATRFHFLEKYIALVKDNESVLAKTISEEVGKPLWESRIEVQSVIHKLPLSVEAFEKRCESRLEEKNGVKSVIYHQPHGAVAIFSPFNFPAHLANGHLIPALLTGNTVILKPSELTPKVAALLMTWIEQANFPKGVINMIQGGPEVGQKLATHTDLNGIYFTGSYKTGKWLESHLQQTSNKILALEMGGNNPLIVDELSDIKAAVYFTLHSAYVTAGQRCTCARRLILVKNKTNQAYYEKLVQAIPMVQIGYFQAVPEPFYGPVISSKAADKIQASYQSLLDRGAEVICALERLEPDTLFKPGLIDVSNITDLPDEEIFGPLLQLYWVDNFEAALQLANHTQYGLAAGILTDNDTHFESFKQNIRAGVIVRNQATTGSSGRLPFGGIGRSGNFRPAAYYSVDYCVYPVSSQERQRLTFPEHIAPGLSL